jgi:hypothetical protein
VEKSPLNEVRSPEVVFRHFHSKEILSPRGPHFKIELIETELICGPHLKFESAVVSRS